MTTEEMEPGRRRVIIQLVGLQRSGNHAVIGWLGSLFRSSEHLNDLPFDFFSRETNRAALMAREQIDCVICSFEDSRRRGASGALLADVSFLQPEDFPGWECHIVYVLRDPYNCWASRAKAHEEGAPLTSSPRLDQFLENWKQMAARASGSEATTILFNRWFRDRAYRMELCGVFGGSYSEASLADVPRNGGGSSFDGYRPSYGELLGNAGRYLSADFLGRLARNPMRYLRKLAQPRPDGRALNVESRWEYLLKKAHHRPIFHDDELRRHAFDIFGFYVDERGQMVTGPGS